MAELINIPNSNDQSQVETGAEQPISEDAETSKETPVTDSPKPLAFTIDFGPGKAVDTNKFKNMFEKYQNRHRRGQSMSKIPAGKETTSVLQKPPSSTHFPRKANTDYHSEGYFSSDQEDKSEHSFLRQLKMLGLKSNVINATIKHPGKSDLTLPLQNTTIQKLDKFSPNNFDLRLPSTAIEDLNDISSPEFDFLNTPVETPVSLNKPNSKRLSSFDESTESKSNENSPLQEGRILNNLEHAEELIIIEPNEQIGTDATEVENEGYEIEDLDDQEPLSDSVSETGLYY